MGSREAQSYRQQGQKHYQQKDLPKAVACLQKAVALDDRDHESHAILAGIYSQNRDLQRAVLHAMRAVAARPGNLVYKQSFIRIAGAVPFVKHDGMAEEVLLACLETEGLDCSETQGLWHSLVALHPVFRKFYDAGSLDQPRPDLSDQDLLKFLSSPFFLRGLEQVVVFRKAFENFIGALRKDLLALDRLGKEHVQIAMAVACYAFNTEYILSVSPQENEMIPILRTEVENASVPDVARAALLGCYMALSELKNAKAVANILGRSRLAKMQILDIDKLAQRRSEIQTLTPIDDAVSRDVNAQYESFPYPRWSAAPRIGFDVEIRNFLPQGALKVLSAGCGTGQEVIQLALSLEGADILAVDLSRSSLAYAAGKAKEFGLRNIAFRQGDILKLDVLNERYDYITSMGVLHHMRAPLEGWRVLSRMLKPGGIMRVGLYSEKGRADVVAARQAIERAGIKPDMDGIREFRLRCRELLPKEMAEKLEWRRDYYTASMCRDLVFHVQEHRFDIPLISHHLRELGLEFIRFDSAFSPPGGKSLEDWDAFEKKNPEIFKNMYKFWCRKPPA